MARKVFFSFHHQADSWRAGVVRNSWLTKGEENTFLDDVDWESIKSKGDVATWKWINSQLENTTATIVLIGSETFKRRWVRYEIQSSVARGNGIVGIYIHGIENKHEEESSRGYNPLDDITVLVESPILGLIPNLEEKPLSTFFKTYFWKDDKGKDNLPKWIEESIENARKLAALRPK